MIKKLFFALSVFTVACSIVGCSKITEPTSTTTSRSTTLSTTSTTFTTSSTTSTSNTTVHLPGTTSSVTKTSRSLKTERTTVTSGDTTMNPNCRLIVKGKDITAGNYVKLNYEYGYAELPFLAVIKELGATVQRQDKTIVKVMYDGVVCTLNMEEGTLFEDGKNYMNAFILRPGSNHGSHHYSVIGDEFIIDHFCSRGVIEHRMGAKIDIDFEKGIVKIG